MNGTVAVLGGTGYLGSACVRKLMAAGWEVRVVCRRPGQSSAGCETAVADVRDAAALASAFEGVRAVVNAVGLYVQHGDETFEAVHVRGAANAGAAAGKAGAERLVHVSGIGADARSRSAYVRARAEGEQAARAAFAGADIVRPSVLFGPGDGFLGSLDALTRFAPVVPLFGDGTTRLQPVFVDDVAAAVAAILEADPGRVYELGGPRALSYREIVALVLAFRHRRRVLMPVAFPLWEGLARVAAALPSPPLTTDQLALLREHNEVGEGVATFADLGIAPRDLEALLGRCLD